MVWGLIFFIFILNLLVQELLILNNQIVNKPEILAVTSRENTGRLFYPENMLSQNEFSFLIFNLTVLAVFIEIKINYNFLEPSVPFLRLIISGAWGIPEKGKMTGWENTSKFCLFRVRYVYRVGLTLTLPCAIFQVGGWVDIYWDSR